MNVFSAVWFAAAVGGVVAVLVGFFMADLRQRALTIAGAAFAIAGVLGIFSIGIVFIGLAVVCFRKANRSDGSNSPPEPPPTSPGS